MGSEAVITIDTSPVDQATAAEIESAEAQTWADLYAAAPAEFAESAGLGSSEVGGAVVFVMPIERVEYLGGVLKAVGAMARPTGGAA